MPNKQNPDILVAMWRYFTGAHLDGQRRTNATWRKPGTIPKQHVTWWTGKPRFHRMGIRWATILVPAGYLFAYSEYKLATLFVTLAFLPYAIHHGSFAIHQRSTMVHKVAVPERPSMARVREHKPMDEHVAAFTESTYAVEVEEETRGRKPKVVNE